MQVVVTSGILHNPGPAPSQMPSRARWGSLVGNDARLGYGDTHRDPQAVRWLFTSHAKKGGAQDVAGRLPRRAEPARSSAPARCEGRGHRRVRTVKALGADDGILLG